MDMKKIFVLMFFVASFCSVIGQSVKAYEVNSKWGFKNKKNEVIQRAVFDSVWIDAFTNKGLALYGDGKLLGITNLKGKWISRPDSNIVKDANFFSMFYLSENVQDMNINDALNSTILVYGMEVKTDQVFCYDSVYVVSPVTCIQKDTIFGRWHQFPVEGRFYLMRGNSKLILDKPVDNFSLEYPLLFLKDEVVWCGMQSCVGFEKNYFIRTMLKFKESPEYLLRHCYCFVDENHVFPLSILRVQIDNKWGWINLDGEWIMPAKYDSILGYEFFKNGVLHAIFDTTINSEKPFFLPDEKEIASSNDYKVLGDLREFENYRLLYAYLYDSHLDSTVIRDTITNILNHMDCSKETKVFKFNVNYFTTGTIRILDSSGNLVSPIYFDNVFFKLNQVEKEYWPSPFCFDTIPVFDGYRLKKHSKWFPLITKEYIIQSNRDYFLDSYFEKYINNQNIIGVKGGKYFLINHIKKEIFFNALEFSLNDSLMNQIHSFFPSHQRILFFDGNEFVLKDYSGRVYKLDDYISIWEEDGHLLVSKRKDNNSPVLFGAINENGEEVIPVEYSQEELFKKLDIKIPREY